MSLKATLKGGFLVPKTKTHIRPAGVGSQTVRLADIPLGVRLEALDLTLRTAKTMSEATRLLRLALDPGDAGGRIAA